MLRTAKKTSSFRKAGSFHDNGHHNNTKCEHAASGKRDKTGKKFEVPAERRSRSSQSKENHPASGRLAVSMTVVTMKAKQLEVPYHDGLDNGWMDGWMDWAQSKENHPASGRLAVSMTMDTSTPSVLSTHQGLRTFTLKKLDGASCNNEGQTIGGAISRWTGQQQIEGTKISCKNG